MTTEQPTLKERMAAHIATFEKIIEKGYAGYYASKERLKDIIDYYHLSK